jgi:hypothetical protein
VTSFWRWLAAALALGCGAVLAAPEATSPDGRWRVAGADGSVLVVDAGQVVKTLPARSLDGSGGASLTVVRFLAARRSFVIAFDTLDELWELSVDPAAPPVFEGLVHDYRMGEALGSPGFLGVRRTRLDFPARELAVDASQAYVVLRGADAPDGRTQLALAQLDVRRVIARWTLAAEPDLAAARSFSDARGRLLIEMPDRRAAGGPPITVDVRAAALRAPQGDP